MPQIHCDPEQLLGFSRRLVAFEVATRAHLDRLVGFWSLELAATWRDAGRQAFEGHLMPSLDAVREGLRGFEAHRGQLERLVRVLNAYLDQPYGSSGTSSGGSAAGPPASVLSGALPAGLRQVGSVSSHLGSLALIDFSQVNPNAIDWGEKDFPRLFLTERHHGHQADDYRALVRGYRPGESSPFLSDPIVIDIDTEGRASMTDGRHRAMAAIEGKVVLPVLIRRAPRRDQ